MGFVDLRCVTNRWDFVKVFNNDQINAKSFELVEDLVGKDKNNVYLIHGKIIPDADWQTFTQEEGVILNQSYKYKDQNNYYNFFGELIEIYSDIEKSDYKRAILNLTERGVLNGYGDDTFKPDNQINRAEFAKITLEATRKGALRYIENCFNDVGSDWYAVYVCAAKDQGLISGYGSTNLFKPDNNINLVEAAKIIVEAFYPEENYTDSDLWYRGYLLKLSQEKALPPTIHSLRQKITRGKMAEMIWRLSENISNQDHISFEPFRDSPFFESFTYATPLNYDFLIKTYHYQDHENELASNQNCSEIVTTKPIDPSQITDLGNYYYRSSEHVFTLSKECSSTKSCKCYLTEYADETGVSPGVFYPNFEDQTINNPRPTIIGKIDNAGQYLQTKISKVEYPHDSDLLEFIPGKISNLEIYLNNQKIETVYGFAQWPGHYIDLEFVVGKDETVNPGTKNPPLIFITKPEFDLTKGDQNLTLKKDGQVIGSMNFNYDPDYQEPIEPRIKYDDIEKIQYDDIDDCAPGYYYPEDNMPLPRTIYDNEGLLNQYRILGNFNTYPQTPEKTNPKLYLKFDDQIYNLFLPQGNEFYTESEYDQYNYPLPDPYKSIFLPIESVYYDDPLSANYKNITKFESPSDHYNVPFHQTSVEIMPVDLGGRIYPKNSVYHVKDYSSGCDG
jgi:hypothetical protein